MAIIQLGSLISGIKGSIGGITFSSNAAGICAKQKVRKRKSVTGKQSLSLQNNNAAVAAWASLSLSNKNAWIAYASLYSKTDRYGVSKTLTGFNWFVSIFNASMYVNGTFPLVPPTYGLPASLPSFSVNVNSSDFIITFDSAIDDSLIDIMIYTTPPVRTSSELNRGLLRFTSKGTTDYTTSFSIKQGWEDAHGLLLSSLSSADNFNINTQIFAISKSSFITGTGVTANSSYIALGIGSMAIGSTFQVG
jgi:hypothetical protein